MPTSGSNPLIAVVLRITQANNDKMLDLPLDLPRLLHPHMELKVCFRGQTGKHLLTSRLTGFDPN